MATVVKGFETMNLPLTRRKFLSIVKKEKERKRAFLFVLLFLLPLNLKLLLLVEIAEFLCCCSKVMSLPFFHCSFFRVFFGSLSCFLSSVMID